MDSYWRQKRKNIIILLFLIIVIVFSVYKIYPYFNKPASCSDNKQNGDERGVDCGGSCAFICLTDVIPLSVKSSKVISYDSNIYDVVGLVENKNKDKDTLDGNIDYTFSIYDKYGSLVKDITGSTTIPLGQTFPILIQNIPIELSGDNNKISNVILKIQNNKSWESKDSVYSKTFFKIVNTDYKQNYNNISQLKVNIKNLSKASFRNVPVNVLLYDNDHNLIATNGSMLKDIQGSETKEVVFTWRSPLSIEDPKVEVYPIVTPFTYIK